MVTLWAVKSFGTGFPWGTALVNIAGCFLIGLLMTFGLERSMFSTEVRLFLVTGLLGGFTTFSAFGYESISPLFDGNLLLAIVNVAVNLVAGLVAVAAGIALARTF
jgi:CrcB protein